MKPGCDEVSSCWTRAEQELEVVLKPRPSSRAPPPPPPHLVLSAASSSSIVQFVAVVQQPPSERGSPRASHAGAASVLEELLHHRGVGQRGDVPQVPLVTGDFAKHPSHDLTWRERRGGCGDEENMKKDRVGKRRV